MPGHHIAGQVGDRDMGLVPADVDTHDVGRLGPEPDQPRRTAGTDMPVAAGRDIGEQASGMQLLNHLPDGGA